jgi:hypothetical protein
VLNKKSLITLIFAIYSIILAIPGILFSVGFWSWDIYQFWHSLDPWVFFLMIVAYLILMIFGICIIVIHLIDLKK